MHNRYVQFIKFAIVGVSNTFIAYVINVFCLWILRGYQLNIDYIIGNVMSFLLSVLWSFYWNEKYVFTIDEGEQRNRKKALLKTYISYGFTGILLNNFLSYIWISQLAVSKYFAPLLNLIISVPVNFLMNKFWAFKK